MTCSRQEECQDELRCNTDARECELALGTLELGEEGDACSASSAAPCDLGLTCLTQDGGASTCVPLGKVGDACEQRAQCASGLRCTSSRTLRQELGTCQELSADGGECFSNEDCAEALACLGASLNERESGTCGAALERGAACSSLGECATRSCRGGVCDAPSGDPTCDASGF